MKFCKQILRVAMISVHGNPLVHDHELGSDGKGGQNVYVREVGKTLSELNCDVTWLTRSESPQEVGTVNLSSTLRCQYIVAGPQEHINRDLLFQYLEEFSEQIDGSKYDVLLTNYWLSGFVGLRLHEKYGLLQAHIHHSLGAVKYKHVNMPSIGPVRLHIEDLINKRVACIIHQTETELQNCNSANPTIIKPGINTTRFRELDRTTAKSVLGLDDNVINVLYAGRFAPQKGIQFALDALNNSTVPHIFRLIGNKSGALDITSSDPRVEFLGSKTQDALALYMAASDILVMPSLYEPFGIVAIEAMATGCCLIVSATGGLNEIVKHGVNGFKVPPGNAKAIQEAFEAMSADSSMRAVMHATNMEEAKQYSWQATASQIRQELLVIATVSPQEIRVDQLDENIIYDILAILPTAKYDCTSERD
ncbi:D-inositol 3-phosphate glycosyltransferase-like [Amphiura filiformis]|uniref:D-inositol 3-phosphate glycosyltransferase-like n=1 Tax=Amphiura filiformis TaxID=82378 RepID=UPI003B211042